MKIAIIINDLCVRGGTHKQVLRLCEYLRYNNIDFGIYTKYYDPNETYSEFKEFDIVSLTNKQTVFSSGGNIFERFKRSRLKKQEDRKLLNLIPNDVKIFNFHDNGMLWMMKWAKTKRKAKVVWQINDLPVCYRIWLSKAHKKSLGNRISRLVYRPIIKRIDKITVNVTKNKDRIVELMNKDAEVFYCGVDTNKELFMHTYSADKKTYRILSAGVFFPRRNYETLVDVIFKLKNDSVDVHLDIIGSTELDNGYAKKILDQISVLKLNDNITIWGQVDEQKYNELFNNADIFSFININQSWGLAVFEAMSCGLPTIVSNSVGAIELLHDGYDSIIVDPLNVDEISEVIKKLISNKELYNMISHNASEAVKEYTWDNLYSSKMLELFKNLMKG